MTGNKEGCVFWSEVREGLRDFLRQDARRVLKSVALDCLLPLLFLGWIFSALVWGVAPAPSPVTLVLGIAFLLFVLVLTGGLFVRGMVERGRAAASRAGGGA